MIKKKIKYLFLGYGKKETNLIDFLRKKGIQVKHLNRKLKNKDLKDIDLIISFGYKKIIKQFKYSSNQEKYISVKNLKDLINDYIDSKND